MSQPSQREKKGVAVVSGAAQGIGRAVALRLAMDGFDIAVNDIPLMSAKLDDVVRGVRSYGRRAISITGDASVEADVEKLVAVTVKELGELNVFVANAGVSFSLPLLQCTTEDWERVMGTNARSVFLGYRIAARQMIAQGVGGRIIGASSVAGKQAIPSHGIYSASKFAIRALTQAAAAEFAKHRITVNAYAPGTIDTPMVEKLGANMTAAKGKWRELMSEGVPLKRLGTPEETAALVSYLASDESGFVTGQSFSINGGAFFD